MPVPAYYRSHHGRVFRVERVCYDLPDGGARYRLRAYAVDCGRANGGSVEVGEEIGLGAVRDRVRRGLAVPTSEQTFEQLWQRLRLELETP